MNQLKILVTGSAGHLGEALVRTLAPDNEVIGLDVIDSPFTQVVGTITDREIVESCMVGVDCVLHTATLHKPHMLTHTRQQFIETNLTGTLNLLELCRLSGIKKFVLASTSSLYGAKNTRPFGEEANTDGPLSPYAASKKAAEALCYTYHHLHGLDVTIFRYFTVYGPAGRPDMSIFRFIKWIAENEPLTLYGDGTQERDFTYVDDIARGTVLGLKPLGYEIINLGSDTPVVLLDTVRMVEEAVGRKAHLTFQPRHPADVLATWANISKAKELLGWQPQQRVQEGMRCLAEWYQANRVWAKNIQTS